jgi:hypothetical protein
MSALLLERARSATESSPEDKARQLAGSTDAYRLKHYGSGKPAH